MPVCESINKNLFFIFNVCHYAALGIYKVKNIDKEVVNEQFFP